MQTQRPREWRLAYVRDGAGGQISPSGKRGVIGSAIYDLETGRYLGAANTGRWFAEDKGFTVDWGNGGLSLVPVTASAHEAEVRAPGGFVQSIVVSPQRDRILTIEEKGPALSTAYEESTTWAVVRALPDLHPTIEATVEVGSNSDGVQSGFLADGQAVVLADASCHTERCATPPGLSCKWTRCAERAAFIVGPDGLRPLGDRFRGVGALNVSQDGKRAVMSWSDHRELVALPSGDLIAELGAPSNDEKLAEVTLNETGQRIAYFGQAGLVVADVTHAGPPDVLYRDPSLTSGYLSLSPDGTTLLASGRDDLVRVVREGAPVSKPPFDYPTELPKGFEHEQAAPYQARYTARNGMDYVTVTASDADEFGPPQLPSDRWAALVVERFEGGSWQERAVTFQSSSERAVETSYFRREGCDPADIYTRYTERGPLLYRVQITVPPNTSKKHVLTLMRAFFDAPNGTASGARALANPPATSKDPC